MCRGAFFHAVASPFRSPVTTASGNEHTKCTNVQDESCARNHFCNAADGAPVVAVDVLEHSLV